MAKNKKKAATSWLGPVLLILVLSSSFLGGAIMTFLSPAQVKLKLETWLRSQSRLSRIEITTAELTFFDGLVPRIGLQLRGLSVQPANECQKGFQLRLQDLYMPLSWRQLFQRKFQVIVARAGSGELHELRPHCTSGVIEPDRASGPGDQAETSLGKAESHSSENSPLNLSPGAKFEAKDPKKAAKLEESPARIRRYVLERLPKDRMRLERMMAGLQMKELRIFRAGHSEAGWKLSDVQILWNRSNAPIRFQLAVEPLEEWQFEDQTNLRLAVEGQVEAEVLKAHAVSSIQEGQVEAQLNWLMTTHQMGLRVQLTNVPAIKVFEFARKAKLVTDKIVPKRTWLNCGAFLQVQLDQVEQSSLDLEDCRLEGEIGKLVVAKLRLLPWQHPAVIQPFQLRAEAVSLRHVLSSLERKGPSGILTEFGQLGGVLEFESPEKVTFQGQLENLELRFSNRSVRGSQSIRHLRGAVQLAEGRVSGLVDQVEIPDGQMQGMVSFNVDRSFREGVFQVKLDQLSFQPSVQELMMGGRHEPWAIYGQGRFDQGEIKQWSGDFGTASVSGPGWLIREAKLRTNFEADRFQVQIRAKEARLMPEHFYYSTLRPLWLNEGFKGPLGIYQVAADLDVKKGGGQWSRAMARDAAGQMVFSSSGEWQREFWQGWIEVDFTDLKSLRWELGGSVQQPKLQPSLKLLKELAQKKPGRALPAEWLKRQDLPEPWPPPLPPQKAKSN